MAQPTNTYDTYDQTGIREDLSDMIHDISPDETPFFTACGKSKATNTLHEWQTDALRSSADNAHIEGDDTTASSVTPTSRLGNYTQIFKNAVLTTGTDAAMNKAGRAREMAYQIPRVMRAQKLDIEKALFANQARVAGSGSAARRLAGAPSWLVTNVSKATTGGSNPTGDGTDARTDGTQLAFSQTRFDTVMQSVWTAGGNPDVVYLSSFQMDVAQGFTGNNSQRATVDASKNQVVNFMSVYVTPWGTIEFKPTRENRSRDIFVMQSDMWKVAYARTMKNEALAKTGDNEKRQVLCELTLECSNEAASGIIADNTTS